MQCCADHLQNPVCPSSVRLIPATPLSCLCQVSCTVPTEPHSPFSKPNGLPKTIPTFLLRNLSGQQWRCGPNPINHSYSSWLENCNLHLFQQFLLTLGRMITWWRESSPANRDSKFVGNFNTWKLVYYCVSPQRPNPWGFSGQYLPQCPLYACTAHIFKIWNTFRILQCVPFAARE